MRRKLTIHASAIEEAFRAGRKPTETARLLSAPLRTVEEHFRRLRETLGPQPRAGEASWKGVRQKMDPSGDLSLESRTDRIKTLEQLLAETKVDLAAWRVAEFVVNKWEVGAKNSDGEIVVEPLFQVKARLQPRKPVERGLADLIKTLEEKAPRVWPLPRRSEKASRALEICVMDPHIGLLCLPPEADRPWSIEIASAAIREAVDDLIAKASVLGPFRQVFMPFGNDFVHADDVFHRTTAGTLQPEAISYHHVYTRAQEIAIEWIEKLRLIAKEVFVYQIPGNHSRVSDFTMGRLLRAYFRNCPGVLVDDSSSPYKFHRFGVNLIGYEHGHSVSQIRLASLMANERPQDWAETRYREWHLGDQHRKGSAKPSALEEQGVSVEFIPGIVAPNEWHRLKGFNHQQRGAMAFVWDENTGPVARIQHNILR